jgi:hypothetical protein
VDNASAVSEPLDDYGEMGTSKDDACRGNHYRYLGPTEFGGMRPHEPLAIHDDKTAETQPQQERATVIEPSARKIQGDIVDRVLAVADDLVRSLHNEEFPDVMLAVFDRGADGTTAYDESVGATSEPTLLGGGGSLIFGRTRRD